ncbi:MAG: hypothetical protein M3Z21_11240, partial [Pseudomonadota bacterium]|nr:hypothetical protein [Pseudomonadota bacterium]
ASGVLAETCSLLGSNAKVRWRGDWERAPEAQRRRRALRSPHLLRAYAFYHRGFAADLNHFYSGVNALGLLVVATELAGALPEVWAEGFDTDEEAQRERERLLERRRTLAAAIGLSLEAARRQPAHGREADAWADVSAADLKCLTLDRPARVARIYRDALAEARDFNFESVRRQLAMYRQLDIHAGNVEAALRELDELERLAGVGQPGEEKQALRVLLFTGHMIDKPGRGQPRFPAAQEDAARQAIRDALEKQLKAYAGAGFLAIAGGACGGDILFQEICAELGIPGRLYLALPRDQYIASSVGFAGPGWVERFDRLYQRLPRRVLADSGTLPRWLRARPGYSLWERNNLWTLYNALAFGGQRVTLIALWDGKAGDGPGGTRHMVEAAEARGAQVVMLDTNRLFGGLAAAQ